MIIPSKFTPEIGAEIRRFLTSTPGQVFLDLLRVNRPRREAQTDFQAGALQAERIGGYEDCIDNVESVIQIDMAQIGATDELQHVDPRRFTSKVMPPHAQTK